MKKRIVINRSNFSHATFKRQHKYRWLPFWITVHYVWIEGSYRYFDDLVEKGKNKGYEIIYK